MTQTALFDHNLLLKRRNRAVSLNVKGADFLLKYISEELKDRISLIDRTFQNPVQIQGGAGIPAKIISELDHVGKFRFIDMINIQNDTDQKIDVQNAPFDLIPLEKQSADFILSPLALQLTNDTPGFLIQVKNSLKPDGLFMAATLGTGTLTELRQALLTAESELTGGATSRVAPFADIRDYGGLLQRAGFALPVIDSDTITVRYNNIFDLMHDLRHMGATNPLREASRNIPKRELFKRADEIYKDLFSDHDGRIRASFVVIYLSGWAPHESQQKPLKPGSAKTRLADALNVEEVKLPKG